MNQILEVRQAYRDIGAKINALPNPAAIGIKRAKELHGDDWGRYSEEFVQAAVDELVANGTVYKTPVLVRESYECSTCDVPISDGAVTIVNPSAVMELRIDNRGIHQLAEHGNPAYQGESPSMKARKVSQVATLPVEEIVQILG